MAHLLAFEASDLATLARAEPDFLRHVARLLAEGIDPVLHVLRRPGEYDVLILGVRHEAVITEHVVTITPRDELTHFICLGLYLDQLAEKHERWRIAINRQLAALGRPIKPLGFALH